MENIKQFLKENLYIICTVLLLFVFMQTCRINSNVKDVENLIKRSEKYVIGTIDSNMLDLKNDLIKEIEIEGLRTEKRMIQSTDRKMLDVNRQSQIDKEIKLIEESN